MRAKLRHHRHRDQADREKRLHPGERMQHSKSCSASLPSARSGLSVYIDDYGFAGLACEGPTA
jgi:hypothetical protein